VDETGVFHKIPRMDDSRLAEIFAREVLADLVRKELLSPEWAEKILSWQHTGFSVHSLVRATTKPEAERVGKYMIRPLLALERLFFLEKEGKVGYRHGQNGSKQEVMDYLELIARVTSHIPDKGQVMVRYYGLYANAHRGKVRKASLVPSALRIVEEELRHIPSKGWAEMIRKVYEVDPMLCPKCGGTMKIISFLTEYAVVDRVIDHLKLTFVADRPPPPQVACQEIFLFLSAFFRGFRRFLAFAAFRCFRRGCFLFRLYLFFLALFGGFLRFLDFTAFLFFRGGCRPFRLYVHHFFRSLFIVGNQPQPSI